MDVSKYLYLLPIAIACTTVIAFLLTGDSRYRLQDFQQRNRSRLSKFMTCIIDRLIHPNSRIGRFYNGIILRHSSLTIQKLLCIKVVLLFTMLVLIILIKYTNISIHTEEIMTKFDYYVDFIYTFESSKLDVELAMAQEMHYFNTALEAISKIVLRSETAEEVQHRIRDLINTAQTELQLPQDTLANKIYHRLIQYYRVREHRPLLYLSIALLASFIPEIFLLVNNFFIKADARKELRLLKYLIILNGSIKPVNFMEVLSILIDKSKYYKTVLKEVEDRNKRNTIDKRTIYSDYIRNSRDLDLKLFFEKLDEANNYDFDQAIVNIQNEFRLQRREEIRKIRKRIEFIHIIGILGFTLIIALLIAYLIVPWMQLYDMKNIII